MSHAFSSRICIMILPALVSSPSSTPPSDFLAKANWSTERERQKERKRKRVGVTDLYKQSKNDNKKIENSQATYVCLLAACM